ncbi:MAG TPA: AsmA family protein [Beijerinckiaceae bacterium]|nr:AsmA family protein [Beijerinckiaceae bacterium]
MREFLTFIGIVLCLALAALMAGPHFVDWDHYRPQIENRLAASLGMPVSVNGPVSVTLLPTPSLTLEKVRFGSADGGKASTFEADRLAVVVSATSLLRGEIHVTEALIDAPVLKVRQGAPLLSMSGSGGVVRPEQISIESLRLRDGKIVVERDGQPDLRITGLSADLEANSLIGPAKGSGSFVVGTTPRTFRFALGKLEEGRSRLKALVEDAQLALRLDADGVLGLVGAGAGFEGSLHLSGNPTLGSDGKGPQLPVRVSTRSRIDGTRAVFDDVSMVIGAEPQPLTLTGNAGMTFDGRRRVEATLSARSFDFDRPGPDGKPRAAVPVDLIRQAAALVPGGTGVEAPDFDLDVSVGGIIVGGQTIVGGRVAISKDASGIGIEALEGELPGQTRIKLARSAKSPAGLLAGRIEAESRDPERFLRWLTGEPGVATSGLSLKASAELETSVDGFRLREIGIERGDTRLSGEGSFLLAVPGQRPVPRVVLKLASPRLNIVDVPGLTFGEKSGESPDIDLDFEVEATKLVFEGNETGRLMARIRRDGPIVSIERLAVTEFGGASLIASGTIGGGARRVTVKLDANRVEALTALGEKLVPGAFMASVRHRSPLLAPALVVATFANDDADDSYDIRADGHLAGTKVQAAGKLSGRTDLRLDLELGLESADGALLAAQIGGHRSPAVGAGPAKIDLSMRGDPRGSLSTVLTGSMPGVDARVIGNIRIFQPFAPFAGDLTIRAADLGPVAAALGVTHPAIPKGTTATLSGHVESNLERITIENLKAQIGGQEYSGEIAFSLAENGKVAGQIKTPYVDFRPVIGLALGAPRAGAAPWASTAFADPMAPPLPGDLWIEADRARLDDKTLLNDAKFVLRFDRGAASVEYAQFALGPARVEGDVFLRRTAGTAFLSSKLKASGIRLEQMGDGSAKGLLDVQAQFSGSGESPDKLIAALAGGGALTMRQVQAPRYDPDALGRLLAMPLDKLGPLDAANLTRRLEAELERSHWTVAETRVPIVVVNGVVRTGATAIDSKDARHEAQAALDLGGMVLDVKVTTSSAAVPADWRGAHPQFSTQWRGPVPNLRRSLAVDSLVNGYLSLALVRDLQKTEVFEQDVRERSAHNRRLKADEAMRRRADELSRFEQIERERREKAAEEQRQLEARLAEDARRRAEEEERARAEKAAEAERQRAAEEESQRQARLAEEEAARIQRIQRLLQNPETMATPTPRRSVAPQPQQAPLAPPLSLNPPTPGRPRVAAPVEIRPLNAPSAAPDTAR